MTYTSLFGLEGPVDSGVTDVAEHGRVGNVSTGQPFKYVSQIDSVTGTNPQTNGSQKTQIVTPNGDSVMDEALDAMNIVNTGAISLVDALNSTTTPLTGNATFTGTAVEALKYSGISIMATSDKASSTSGYQLQWSQDGTNWDHVLSDTLIAGTCQIISSGPIGRYYRVVFTNGSSAQTYFRLQTIKHSINKPAQFGSLDKVMTASDYVNFTKGLIVGKTTAGGGGYVDVKVNPSGALTVDASGSSITTIPTIYTDRIDTSSTTNAVYFGSAAVGSAEGSAVWMIYKLDKSSTSNLTFKFADGDSNYNNIWSNRTSLTYT